MGVINRLFEWRDDRDRLRELIYRREDASAAFGKRSEGLRESLNEYQSAYAEFRNDIGIIDGEISSIETRRAIERSLRWSVPLPPYPDENGGENEFWAISTVYGRYYLTDVGLSRIRREVYNEWEMWSKPWLSYGAIAISAVSLLVALSIAFARP